MKYLISLILVIFSINVSHATESKILYVTSGILAGALSGAMSGYLIKEYTSPKRGPTGKEGIQGLQGPQGLQGEKGSYPFVMDNDASLNFKFSILMEKEPPFGTIAVPFVSIPDGTIINNHPVSIGGQTTINLGYIQVANPVFGTYHLGIKLLTTSSPLDDQLLQLIVESTASRNDKVITTIIEMAEFYEFKASDQTQITAEFTYGNDL